MTIADAIFALVLLYALLRSYARGLLATAATYAAPVLAFLAAADWSDPVRDRLLASEAIPDFAADLAAPALVFVAVVVVVRVAAAVASKFFGIGMSVPSRVVASTVGATLVAFVLGLFVAVLHRVIPPDLRERARTEDLEAAPVAGMLLSMERSIDESLLGPPLGLMAESLLGDTLEGLRSGTPPALGGADEA